MVPYSGSEINLLITQVLSLLPWVSSRPGLAVCLDICSATQSLLLVVYNEKLSLPQVWALPHQETPQSDSHRPMCNLNGSEERSRKCKSFH